MARATVFERLSLAKEATIGTVLQPVKRLHGLKGELKPLLPMKTVDDVGGLAPDDVLPLKESSELNVTGDAAFNELLYLLSGVFGAGDIKTPGSNGVFSLILGTQTPGAGCHYTLTYGGQTTAAILYSATAAAVQAALEALSTIKAGNVLVSGPPESTFTVTFRAALEANSGLLTGDFSSLTTPGAASIATTAATNTRRWTFLPNNDSPNTPLSFTMVPGTANQASRIPGCIPVDLGLSLSEKELAVTSKLIGRRISQGYHCQNIWITGVPTGGTFTLTYGAQTSAGINWNAPAAAVQAALEALSTIKAGNVSVSGAGGTYSIDLGGATGGTYTLTFVGTTTAIPFGATAADVKAALEALAAIEVGDVTVTGSGTTLAPFVITFLQNLAATTTLLTATFASLTYPGAGAATLTSAPGGPYTVELIGDLLNADATVFSGAATALTGGTSPAVVFGFAAGGLTIADVVQAAADPPSLRFYLGSTILGMTKMSKVLTAKWDVKDRYKGVFNLTDSDLSYSDVVEQGNVPTGQIVVEQDTTADNFLSKMRRHELGFWRIIFTGPVIETGFKYRCQITMPFRITSFDPGDSNGIYAGTFDLGAFYDSGLASFCQVVIDTAVTAV